MEIVATMGSVKPDYRPLAEYWMERILGEMKDGVFTDPELEREYREWLAAREAKKGA